jgi:hypothetical protein
MLVYKKANNHEVIGYSDSDLWDVRTLRNRHQVMSSHSQMEVYHVKAPSKESLHRQ